MAKINIVKPTGSEMLSLLSAFKTENLTYAIFDSEKVGSMGLPIIYIAKLTEKLEKVTDDNEWQSVKNSLKGIINGTNFEYVKVPETINADEAFYTPLTLPQSSFDIIKSRYVVVDNTLAAETESLEQLTPAPDTLGSNVMANEVPTPMPVQPVTNSTNESAQVGLGQNENVNTNQNIPVQPVMPNNNVQSNVNYAATSSVNANAGVMPTPGVVPPVSKDPVVSNVQVEMEEELPKIDSNIFMQDKETFLKACENMFDALVSKYQKQLENLNIREQSLKN